MMIKKFLIIVALAFLSSGCGIFFAPVSGEYVPVSRQYSVSNPFSELADVSPVACYGESRTGVVKFVFTIRSRTNIIRKGDFGGSSGSKFIANGKAYKPYRDKQSVELVQGIVTECIVSDIRDVPNTISRFDRIELDWYFNPAHHSGAYRQTLDFYNVPIIWE